MTRDSSDHPRGFEAPSRGGGVEPDYSLDDYRLGGAQYQKRGPLNLPEYTISNGTLYFGPLTLSEQGRQDFLPPPSRYDPRQTGQPQRFGRDGSIMDTDTPTIPQQNPQRYPEQNSQRYASLNPPEQNPQGYLDRYPDRNQPERMPPLERNYVIPREDRVPLIRRALQLAGVEPTDRHIADVNRIVQRESGWRPNVTNHTDINARRGHPSTGLMQTIPSTFRAFALPGHNTNINDPLSNLIAGIRYAQYDPKYRHRGGLEYVASRSGGY